ncbi:hypothetical protein B0H16DRAFT_1487379 [Mycena metata]|uniref:CxC2-like cysteine cluster KDZ transposase-associated domain-containing protein n=1 Tax=Mycena metata TaxID=1033252 RepID=A0AAD7DEP1_9AGAR|nr:hypothetical protein B0H16DRAFT_1487379 [Mycena metata]
MSAPDSNPCRELVWYTPLRFPSTSLQKGEAYAPMLFALDGEFKLRNELTISYDINCWYIVPRGQTVLMRSGYRHHTLDDILPQWWFRRIRRFTLPDPIPSARLSLAFARLGGYQLNGSNSRKLACGEFGEFALGFRSGKWRPWFEGKAVPVAPVTSLSHPLAFVRCNCQAFFKDIGTFSVLIPGYQDDGSVTVRVTIWADLDEWDLKQLKFAHYPQAYPRLRTLQDIGTFSVLILGYQGDSSITVGVMVISDKFPSMRVTVISACGEFAWKSKIAGLVADLSGFGRVRFGMLYRLSMASDSPTGLNVLAEPGLDAASALDKEIIDLFLRTCLRRPCLAQLHSVTSRSCYGQSIDVHVCETCGIHGSTTGTLTPGTLCFVVCMDCKRGSLKQCQNCCLEQHRSLPLHFVKYWNGQYWRTIALRRLGFIFQLGHGGAVCPSPGPEHMMTVISMNGSHHVRVRYCECLEHHNEFTQLFRAQWFAARATNVKQCVTFETLGMGSV